MMQDRRQDFRLYSMDWIAWILFLFVMMDSSWVLSTANWTDHLGLVSFITVCAVAAGTALARSLFPAFVSALIGSVYGFFLVGWQLGLTLDPALPWHDRSMNLLGRLGVFVQVLLKGDSNHDPLMFVLLMGVLFWVMALWGSWMIFRKGSAWPALLAPGFAVVVNAFYYVGEARIETYLILYIFLALLLLVRTDIKRHQVEWQAIHSRVPGDVDIQINRAGFFIALALVGFAWASPVLPNYESVDAFWTGVTAPIRSARDRIGDAFGGLRSPVSLRAEQYGETLSLTAGIQPEEALVMEVDPERLPIGGGRLYWRSRVYDAYEDGVWSLTGGTPRPFTPDEGNLVLPMYEGREIVRVTVQAVDSAFQVLFVPSQPLWVNRTSSVTLSGSPPDSLEGYAFASEQILMQGEEYRARGSVASPDTLQLRSAGDQYPAWVENTYLQLPENLPDSISRLAEEITAGLDTPYDRAAAITRWLRSNIQYSRVTDPPPDEVDPLEWFLFEYKTGFCNFYASAEVIMLRTLGIPARMAAGYARGTYDAVNGIYIVRSEDAHTWPEVFFPGLGWVEFEPTTSQPVLTRREPANLEDPQAGILAEPGGPRLEDDPLARLEDRLNLEDEPVELSLPEDRRSMLPYWAVGSSLLLISICLWRRLNPAGWMVVRLALAENLARIGIETPVVQFSNPALMATPTGRIYARWSGWLGRLGLKTHIAQTPNERAQLFAEALPEEAERGWSIVDAYTRERFAHDEVDPIQVQSAWREMIPQLVLARLWKLTQRWRR